MCWTRRDLAIVSRCVMASFSLMTEDKVEYIEGLGLFKYLGRPLERPDNDWPAVRRNIRKAHQFWCRLGKIIRREGTDQLVLALFYRSVVQAVLLFGVENWVLLTAMEKTLERFHVGFLRQVAVNTERRQ